MKEKYIVLSPQARAALDRGYLEDYVFKLSKDPLPRPVYQDIKHALSVIGGQWDMGTQGFVFEKSTAHMKILERFLKTGKVLDRRQTFQEFFTPPLLAAEMASIVLHHRNVSADVNSSEVHTVLEPSAGEGALVRALLDGSTKLERALSITAIEIQGPHAFQIPGARTSGQYVEVIHADFFGCDLGKKFDAVCMNPPFDRRTWLNHIRHAMTFLKEGGILVAVVPASATEDEIDELCVLEPVNAKFVHTNVKVQLLTIVKGARSKSEIMLASGYSDREVAKLLAERESRPTLDQAVASEFNKCFRKKSRPFPSAKLKNPDFYIKQMRRDIREVTKRLDELEAELHKD